VSETCFGTRRNETLRNPVVTGKRLLPGKSATRVFAPKILRRDLHAFGTLIAEQQGNRFQRLIEAGRDAAAD
jgi:hypothetical protein